MAIDTREKRQSALSLLVPSFTPGVEPGTMDIGARQAAAWMYSGIVTTVGAPGAGSNAPPLLMLIGVGV